MYWDWLHEAIDIQHFEGQITYSGHEIYDKHIKISALIVIIYSNDLDDSLSYWTRNTMMKLIVIFATSDKIWGLV